MWERFTAQARNVVLAAQQRADNLNVDLVTPEHLLWGILQGQNVAASVLRQSGVDIDGLQRAIEALWPAPFVPIGAAPALSRQPSAAWLVAETHASEEASRTNNKYIGTEHLLIGIGLTDTPAATLLMAAGATIDSLRDRFWKFARYDDDTEPESIRFETSEEGLTRFLEMLKDELPRKRREGMRCLKVYIHRAANEKVDPTRPSYEQFEALSKAESAIVDRKEVFEALVAGAEDESIKVRAASVLMLGRSHQLLAQQVIIERLQEDPNEQVRMLSASALRRAPYTPQKVDAFIAALKDAHHQVLYPACVALGRSGDKRAVVPLRHTMDHETWNVRFHACEALVRLDAVDNRVVTVLEELHAAPEAHHHNEGVKSAKELDEELIKNGLGEPSFEPPWYSSTGAVLALARQKLGER